MLAAMLTRCRRVPAAVGLAAALSAACLAHAATIITDEAPTRDAGQNVAMALEIVRVLGPGDPGPEPVTMYREPLYPFTVALQMLVDPRLAQSREEGRLDGPAVVAVKQQNLVWTLLLLGSVAALAHRLVRPAGPRGRLLAPVFAVAVAYAAPLASRDMMDRTLTELPAAALLALASVLAVGLVDRLADGAGGRRTMTVGVLLGAALGALTLTKASFIYIAPVHVAMLWALVVIGRRRERCDGSETTSRGPSAAGAFLVLLVTFGMLVLPWTVRNLVVFDEPAITGRSGVVLWYRALKNTMTPAEERVAWVLWSPGPLREPLAGLLDVDLNDRSPTSPLRRIDRHGLYVAQEPVDTSLYQQARDDRARLTREFTAAGVTPWIRANLLADAVLRDRALGALGDDPLATLRTTPLFLWRGSWSMLASELLPRALLAPFNPLAMGAVLLAAPLALVRRRERLLAASLLPFGAVLFFALFTHFEGRFALPAVPVGLTLAVVGLVRLVPSWFQRARARTHRSRLGTVK